MRITLRKGMNSVSIWIRESTNLPIVCIPTEKNGTSERKAAELNFGLRRVLGSFHNGSLPEVMGCLDVEQENIIASAVKRGEDGLSKVFRVWEIEGSDTSATVRLFGKSIPVELSHHCLKTYDDAGNERNTMEWIKEE